MSFDSKSDSKFGTSRIRAEVENDPRAKLQREQEVLEKQQKAEKDQLRKKLEQQRIAALRGRFAGSGGVAGDGTSDNSLYSRITGR